MKTKRNFFLWYYTDGLEGYLEIWKNFICFFWRYFSVRDLLFTLFSPWKRDVIFHYWRGWQPLKSLETIIENFFSRFIGLIIRIFFIAAGLIITLITATLGLVLLLVLVAYPTVALVIIAKLNQGNINFIFAAVPLLIFLLIMLISYFIDQKRSYRAMNIQEILDSRLGERILNRLGKTKEEVDVKIFENQGMVREFLNSLNLSESDFERLVKKEANQADSVEKTSRFWLWENLREIMPIGRYWKYAYTVHLDRYSLDLSQSDYTQYRNYDLIAKEKEFEVMNLVLERPAQNNVLLVGEPGIGKKTMIHYLARIIRQHKVEEILNYKRVLIFDLGGAIAHFVNEGFDVENEIRKIFNEAAYAGNVILVLENIGNYIFERSDNFHFSVSKVLVEFLDIPAFQIIATSSVSDYHQLVERSEEMVKFFDVIEMREPDENATIDILYQFFGLIERKRAIFAYEGFKAIIDASGKYNWNSALPERAIDLAEEVLIYWEKNSGAPFITSDAVNEFITLKTGIPLGKIDKNEQDKLLNLEKIMHQRIVGQDEAVRMVSEALRKARTGIANSEKPMGSFLFLGPTGVGKTETAKTLAEVYFGQENKIIRLDMSEYQHPSSIDRIIGSVQTGQPGQLSSKAKDNPYAVLLLDEIEKAYPTILDLFLQILDEGFITDAFGEKINFRNMMIAATSNAGAPLIKKLVEQNTDPKEISKQLIDHIIERNIFRPEFLNRFDGVIFFRPLNDKEIKSVTKLILKDFAARLKKEKNIKIEFEDIVVEKIVEQGYNQVFGARSIYHFIEDKIDDLVIKKVISGDYKKGDKITISNI